VKVHPRARHDRVAGILGEAVKLELTSPPVDGKANEACIRFLADLLRVPRSSVTIAAGATSRNKVVRIVGITAEQVERVIGNQ
jgi:uncharacterized protein (TIGR00251 family)